MVARTDQIEKAYRMYYDEGATHLPIMKTTDLFPRGMQAYQHRAT